MPRFKFAGSHEDHLATGRPLAYGDVVSLNASEAARNARLIDAGLLLELAPLPKPKKTSQESDA